MQSLRVRTSGPTTGVGVRFGMLAGFSFFPLLFIFYSLFARVPYSGALLSYDYVGSMGVYRGYSFLIVFLFLFGVNVHGWNRRRINYIFIFEVRP
jgi:hypothetical protein